MNDDDSDKVIMNRMSARKEREEEFHIYLNNIEDITDGYKQIYFGYSSVYKNTIKDIRLEGSDIILDMLNKPRTIKYQGNDINNVIQIIQALLHD